MTKLWILSDLHDDVLPYSLEENVDADLCILAGDVGGKLEGLGRLWLERNHPRMPLLLVPGNHDFYGADLDRAVERFRRKTSASWVTVLDEGQVVVFDGNRFVGATLWTDYAIAGDVERSRIEAQMQMTDFRAIRWKGRKNPAVEHFENAHRRQRAAIEAVLATPFDGPTVVVTHHAPSARSLDPKFIRGPLDGAYASDLEDLILEYEPDMWIHGHVHRSQDYKIGRTRVLANPRGYHQRVGGFGRNGRWEPENPDFDPRFVIDVQPRPIPITAANVEFAIEYPELFGLPASAGRLYREDDDGPTGRKL